MKLEELLRGMSGITGVRGDPSSVNVTDLACDSRKVVPGALFVAVPGQRLDGASFVNDAVERGACAVVAGSGALGRTECVVVEVEDVRRAMARLAARFFGYPSRGLALVGVTGTNGKTTFTYLMESILLAAGFRPGVIGTIACRHPGHAARPVNTTPESVDLQRTLREMLSAGVTHVLLEVSSHGLDARRVDGCDFTGAVFTMLGRDHLDHHGDVETYYASKARLFTEHLPGSAVGRPWAVINGDDPYGQRLLRSGPVPATTVSVKREHAAEAHYRVASLACSPRGISLEAQTPGGVLGLNSPLLTRVNALNVLLAVAAADRLGVGAGDIVRGVRALKTIPGRLEPVARDNGVLFLVDYAHTPDALDQVLPGLREVTRGRLITVFGCGGDRDRGKRPLMGASAARWSDVVVVTSDNPRSEDPEAILEAIRQGIEPLGLSCLEAGKIGAVRKGKKAFTCLADRREAIRCAVGAARRGDTVLVAGKGHEDVQILGESRVPFQDRDEVLGALRDLAANQE